MPTGPVAAVTRARRFLTSPACCSLTTAATAVVFDPFESSITDTRIGPKKVSLTALRRRSPAGHVGAADEDRGVVQVLGSAREDRAVHQVADVLFRDAAAAHDFVGAAVVGDDAIEDAGDRRRIEL